MSEFEDMKSLSSKAVGLKRDPNNSLGAWSANSSPKSIKNPFMGHETLSISTTITEDVSIKGELVFSDSLRVDGSFEGTLVSEGDLFVGVNGKVIADLQLKSIVIEGKVTGNITATESLDILATAEIKGDIVAPILRVEAGAQILGSVRIKVNEG